MIGEAAYIELIKNCSKWNSRIRSELKQHLPFYDQQTAQAHRASTALKKNRQSRTRTLDPNYLVQFPCTRWRKKASSATADNIEMKYFMQKNPAIADALNVQHAGHGEFPGENSIDSYSGQESRRGATNGKYDDFERDDEEMNFSDGGSDGDDWGAKRKRGKRAPAIGKKKAGPPKETPKPPKKPRFGHPCDICRAKYKSKPGLIHHKAYWHNVLPPPGAPNPNKLFSPSVEVSEFCDLCLGTRFENKNTAQAEDLVSCQDCGRSAHPSCLKFTVNMQYSTKCFGWQCIECKSCAICGTSVNDDQLLFCDDCDRGFHLYCLRPKLSTAPEGEWSCHLCQKNFGEKASAPTNTLPSNV